MDRSLSSSSTKDVSHLSSSRDDVKYLNAPNMKRQALREKLNEVSKVKSKCSTIYRVHTHLRNVNAISYEPEIVSIGPYHCGKDDLKVMEDHKLRYLHLLLSKNESSIERYVSGIEKLESEARECYAEPIGLDAKEFVEMLVLDGCFIIELVRKHNMAMLREKNDPIFSMDWIIISLKRDLMLFENQIPFFVLRELFDLIETPNNPKRLTYLFKMFFKELYPGKVIKGNGKDNSQEIKHLLHLIHCSWFPSFDHLNVNREENARQKRWRFISCLAGLREANVKFKPNEGVGLFDIEKARQKRWRFISSVAGLREANVKFEPDEGVDLFNITFENGTLHIAPLRIEDRTNALFRNLIAYEQYTEHDVVRPVTDYVKFLDCLVDSSEDVEILSRLRIFENWLGDADVVANMINRLSDLVAGPGSRFMYAEIFENVNKHCGKRRNRWMAKLRGNYLNSPWAIISVLAAVVLLLLTVTQTVFSVI